MNKIITYFGSDGLLHIIVSAILMVVFGLFVPAWLAAVIAFLIGTAKEAVWDCTLKRGTPEYKDLFADIIGVSIGVLWSI